MTENAPLPSSPCGRRPLPGLPMPIGAGRPGTLKAIEAALRSSDLVLALAQRQTSTRSRPRGSTPWAPSRARPGPSHPLGHAARPPGRGARHRGARHREGGLPGRHRPARRRPGALRAARPAFVALMRETRERALELAKRSGLPRRSRARCSPRPRIRAARRPGRRLRRAAHGRAPDAARDPLGRGAAAQVARPRAAPARRARGPGGPPVKVREEIGDRQREASCASR